MTMAGRRNQVGHRGRTAKHVTGGPELVDVDGPWWRGFYQAWCDRDEGHSTMDHGRKGVVWSAGYDAGRLDGHVRGGWTSPFWN
jgi:hypothetical protein